MSETAPPGSSRDDLAPAYRPDIDGLRAVAVLSVVAFHAAPGRLPGGFAGVDIFFVISGFLITSILLRSLDADRFSLAGFYARRVKRIFPALALTMATCLGVGYFVLTNEELAELSKHVAGGAGFVSNVLLWTESGYFDLSADFKPLLHLWSLGIEEQFYFIWPIALWVARKLGRTYFAATLLIGAASFLTNIVQVGADPAGAFYLPGARFWELLVGAWLAVRSRSTGTRPKTQDTPRSVASGVGALLIGASFLLLDKTRAFPGWWAALPTLGALAVIWAGPRAWFNRVVLSRRVMVGVGLISFPLYLWHWPALAFLRIVEGTEAPQWKRAVAVAVSFVLAWLTYRMVESRVRHSKRKEITSGLCAIMVVLGGVGIAGYATGGFPGRPDAPRTVNAGDIGHDAFFEAIEASSFLCTPSSVSQVAAGWEGFTRCFQSMPDEGHDIVILGDSHAEHLFPGVATHTPGQNVVFYGNGNGLPFIDNPDYDHLFAAVSADPRARDIVMAANWSQKLDASGTWRASLRATLEHLTREGRRVFLVEAVPGHSFLPSRCKYSGRLGISTLCEEAAPSTTYLGALERVAEASERVSVIRTSDLFCRDGVCSMAHDGRLFYRDEGHLNMSGSEVVGRRIVSSLEASP